MEVRYLENVPNSGIGLLLIITFHAKLLTTDE